MNKLALAAFTTIALTNLAHAQKPGPTWNGSVIEDLLKNEKLVEKFGTLHQPKIYDIDIEQVCEKSNVFDMSIPIYKQEVLGIGFNVGFGGAVRLITDATKVGTELVLGPEFEMIGKKYRPLDVKFSAAHKADNTNALDVTLNGFGYTLATIPITGSLTPITRNDYFGYSLPATLAGSIGDSYDDWSWNAHAEVIAHVGALLTFEISPGGVEAHALASAVAWAELGIDVDIKDTFMPSFTSRIDAVRMLYGGRAMLLPQNGSDWAAEAASSLALTDLMGANVHADLPIYGDYSFFKLEPSEYFKDYAYACKFTNKMNEVEDHDPKAPVKQ